MNKRLPHSKDYEDIDKNAGIAASFVENVVNMVPRDDWTPELRRLVRVYMGDAERYFRSMFSHLKDVPCTTAAIVQPLTG